MSTNVSKEKRERLIAEINEIKSYIASATQDKNTAQLLAYIADIEKDIKGKKYGLVFEEHREKIDEILEQNTPVLTEEKDLFIDNGGQMNFLIEGDNLAALQLLEKTHKGKIDLIYIDPPYNTGNKDFIYDDNFVDANDTFRHSKWLSFMQKRLEIAKRLLSENGVIFISIDDNEYAQLKLMMDEVFGVELFVNDFVWINNLKGRQIGKGGAVKTYEHLFCYSKDNERLVSFTSSIRRLKSLMPSVYKNIEYRLLEDDNGKYVIKNELYNSNSAFNEETRPNLVFKIMYNNQTKDVMFLDVGDDGVAPNGYVVFEPHANSDGKHLYHAWRWSKEKIKRERTELEFDCNNRKIYTKIRNFDQTNIKDIIMDIGNGNAELSAILGKNVFSYPKSTALICFILEIANFGESILDFFAGSGTTGHAVMKLNAEDGGKRKFILCTNNENNICRDVTYERIKRVIERDKYEASVKYYKVDFVPISDKLYYEYADELLRHIRELVELENGINFNGNAEIAIVLTEKELDEFAANMPEKCKAIYLGHDVLPSETQESLFKARGIAVNVIPDYYYRELEG